MEQPNSLVNGHPSAAFFGLAVSLVPCVHVFLRKVAAQKVEVGGVNGDQPRVQQVLHLQKEGQHTGAETEMRALGADTQLIKYKKNV